MDPATLAERNRASVARLESMASALSDDELTRVIDDPWTAGALYAHIAFWDRFVWERWRLAAGHGEGTPRSLDDDVMDRLNDTLLWQWIAVPGRKAVEECVASARELDETLAALDPETVAAVVAEGRPRLVDRSLHRGEHLETIERAFPSG